MKKRITILLTMIIMSSMFTGCIFAFRNNDIEKEIRESEEPPF